MTVDLSLLIYLFTNAHQNHLHTPYTKSPITAPIYRHALSAKPIEPGIQSRIKFEKKSQFWLKKFICKPFRKDILVEEFLEIRC